MANLIEQNRNNQRRIGKFIALAIAVRREGIHANGTSKEKVVKHSALLDQGSLIIAEKILKGGV